jgi:FtsZ-interacting cell division protein ZipA
MSDLRAILLAVGAVLIVLMFAWYKWQEYRLKKRGEAAFGSRHDDVLLASAKRGAPAERIDPVLTAQAASKTPVDTPVADKLQAPEVSIAVATPVDYAPVPVAEPATDPDSTLPLDGRIDALAIIAPGPAAAEGVIDASPLANADWSMFSKAVSRFGEDAGGWNALATGQSCQRVVVALQLVDRKGPVPGMEYAAFAQKLEALATQNDWQLELASSESIAQRATELDRMCQEVDFQITFDVVAAGDKAFPGTRIRALAEANAMALGADGSFCRNGDHGAVWFTLKNRGATPFSPEHMREISTRGLTLALDVPRVPREAFPALRLMLNALCSSLLGTVVDEQGRRLDDAALDLVADQLRAIHARLEQSGIAPGGATALRLFS